MDLVLSRLVAAVATGGRPAPTLVAVRAVVIKQRKVIQAQVPLVVLPQGQVLPVVLVQQVVLELHLELVEAVLAVFKVLLVLVVVARSTVVVAVPQAVD